MIAQIRKGNEILELRIPDTMKVQTLLPKDMPEGGDEEQTVRDALKAPVGSPRLKDIVRPGEKIAVIASDITRPCPTWKIMPALLDELYEAGIAEEDITLIFARGSHRNQTDEEKRHLAGEKAWREIACVDSDDRDTVHFGTTSRGTPVDIDRKAAEADRRICIGNVEYHYFAGYSGGAKALMPGVSTREAIQTNHRFMIEEDACAGKLEGNPIREDIEEAGNMVGIDFIVNVVLNTKKEIVCAVSGDVREAHRAACAYLDRFYRCPIEEKADIVVVSQGGAPKDLNLYQTQKALDNAKHAVKDGGTVILAGSCAEGFGESHFAEWMETIKDPDTMIRKIHEQFILGAHKAAAIAMIARRARIILVSDMDPETVGKTILEPCRDINEALRSAVRQYGEDAGLILMPYGGSTLPICL